MVTNTALRTQAREALRGQWGTGVAATLIFWLIAFVAQTPNYLSDFMEYVLYASADTLLTLRYVSLCLLLLILPLSWGYATLFLRNLRGEPVGVENLFDGYRNFSRIFTTYLLQCIYVMLWSLLLIVPGIVKALSYAMTPFVLLDEPTLSKNAAIERSMAMMQGYKAKLFVLYLSFIGWGLLCILTCGIGTLWLYPYMYTAQAAFYEDVRRDYEQRQLTAQD